MKILVIAPHADDEILGVGGTIKRYLDEGHSVHIAIMTGVGEKDSAHPLYTKEDETLIRNEARRAHDFLGSTLSFSNIPSVLITEYPKWRLNKEANKILEAYAPDILFVPFLNDMHNDHRLIYHAFSVAWRPITEYGKNIKEIYCYETLSETHWNTPGLESNFNPNVWIDITSSLEHKLKAFSFYESQIKNTPHPRSIEGIRNLAYFRAGQVLMNAAEAFVLIRKIT
tara:strand:+ start:168 stop:848 length:681 start_codon:yes stop_codon:yes gene_type:complete